MVRSALFLSALAVAVLNAPARPASVEMSEAAQALLTTLSDDQTAKASFDFSDPERLNWHYIPRERLGLSLKAMTPEQRLLAQGLLATGLSHRGLMKTAGVMSLEAVLAVKENNPVRRDPENYFVSIFGTPGTAPWGWRFEGHHLALNFTIAAEGAAPVVTPNFMGSNPAEVREGPRKGFRVLGPEEDLGRALIADLNTAQRAKAIIMAEAPREIFNVPGRNETESQGISWPELSASQQKLLLDLVHEYTVQFRPDVAAQDLQKLEAAGFETLHFAWAGSIDRGQAHYFRVQSGSFVLEYDNFQNDANHVHSAWRDFDREFGTDLLGAHHQVAHSN